MLIIIYFPLFLFNLINSIISSPTPIVLNNQPESHHPQHHQPLPTINLFEEESQQQKQKIFWKAIERNLENTPDIILLKDEFCKKSCNEIIGRGAEKIQNVHCVCRCPITEPIFVNTREEGKCVSKINDCFGHPLKFEQIINATTNELSLQIEKHYSPTLSLSKKGEPLDFNLNIDWRENGIKMRSRGGPKCLIKNIFILGNNSEWKEETKKELFKLAERGEEGNFNGNLLWMGTDQEIQELSGGIVRLELECATKNNGGGNASFCLAFRIEGQIEFKENEKTEIISNGNVGMEVEKGRRVEVVVIILLGIFLFLSLFGSILLWNVCWRVQKRKLVNFEFLIYKNNYFALFSSKI
ncbi:unnamed protein product [Meloidogyne enterolobii]|uniref:Uncharacterized protein n=1 Tax=Meloidogyne enterolobii TaxID=390850 RepID=A0ACB0Z9A9_MELEN